MDEIGIESARRVLGEIVDKARFTGEPTLIARQAKPAAVIVNYDWYQQAKAAERPGRGRTVHYHWPVQCGLPALPAGDTWSGNLDLVTCAGCLGHAEPAIGIRDEAEEFGFGRNAAPPWEEPTS